VKFHGEIVTRNGFSLARVVRRNIKAGRSELSSAMPNDFAASWLAGSQTILRNVISEGIFIGLMS